MQHRAIPLPIAVLGHILYIKSNYFIGWRPQWRNIEFDERDFKIKLLSQSICFSKVCQHYRPSYFVFWWTGVRGERWGESAEKKTKKTKTECIFKTL